MVAYASRFDPQAVTPAQASQVVSHCARIEASVASLKALAAARAAEGSAWKDEGYRSPADQLAHQAGTSPAKARQALKTGRRLGSQPQVAKAALAGELSAEQAATVAEGVEADPSKAAELIELARHSSVPELNEAVAAAIAAVTDLEGRRTAIHAKRSLRRWTGLDGALHAHLYGNVEDGARLWQMLDPVRRRLNILRRGFETKEPFEALDYDAIMAVAAIAAGDDGELGLLDLIDLGLFPQFRFTAPPSPAPAPAEATAPPAAAATPEARSSTGDDTLFTVVDETLFMGLDDTAPPSGATDASDPAARTGTGPATEASDPAARTGTGRATEASDPAARTGTGPATRVAGPAARCGAAAGDPAADRAHPDAVRQGRTPTRQEESPPSSGPQGATGASPPPVPASPAVAAPGEPASPIGTARRPKKLAGSPTRVMIRVDLDTLLRGVTLDGELCEIAGYGPIPVSVIADLLANGNTFVAAVLTKAKKIVGVYHYGRRPNAYQQTGLDFLYPTCAAQGCNTRASLQYDHREDFARTKFTLFDLLDRLCIHHHNLKTRQGWALTSGTGKRPFVPSDDPRHPNHTQAPAAADRSR